MLKCNNTDRKKCVCYPQITIIIYPREHAYVMRDTVARSHFWALQMFKIAKTFKILRIHKILKILKVFKIQKNLRIFRILKMRITLKIHKITKIFRILKICNIFRRRGGLGVVCVSARVLLWISDPHHHHHPRLTPRPTLGLIIVGGLRHAAWALLSWVSSIISSSLFRLC